MEQKPQDINQQPPYIYYYQVDHTNSYNDQNYQQKSDPKTTTQTHTHEFDGGFQITAQLREEQTIVYIAVVDFYNNYYLKGEFTKDSFPAEISRYYNMKELFATIKRHKETRHISVEDDNLVIKLYTEKINLYTFPMKKCNITIKQWREKGQHFQYMKAKRQLVKVSLKNHEMQAKIKKNIKSQGDEKMRIIGYFVVLIIIGVCFGGGIAILVDR